MAIFKAKVETDYTVIPNSTAQDVRLSFEARGMLSLLLSLPHDWAINNAWLIKQSGAGRDKVQRILNELTEYKYLIKAQDRTEKGKFSSNDYLVYAKPVNGKPVDGKTTTTKETELEKKQETNNAHPELVVRGFDFFWKTWGDCKKSLDVKNTSPKDKTLDRFKKMFNATYFKNHTEEQFKQEINDMCETARQAHALTQSDGFNPFRNMQTGKFLTNKQWR